MRIAWFAGLIASLLLLPAPHPRQAEAAARRALCVVCQVKHGESAPEDVKATRTHAGTTYDFCSESCAQAFEADPAAYTAPEFPREAPAFSLSDLSGAEVSNASLAGHVVLLDFWATWCAPCRKSMPELEALHHKYASRGFKVVGVSIDEGGPAKVRKFVRAKKITYPIALDSEHNPAWEAFGVKSVPAAYLLARDGRIVAQWTGAPVSAAALEAKLAELLAAD